MDLYDYDTLGARKCHLLLKCMDGRPLYTQNKQRTPVTTGILPFSSNSTISRPNSSACLRWNGVVRLVDLDMVIARASLPLV